MRLLHFRNSRRALYVGALVAAISICIVSISDAQRARLVTARELFGLWALALLLTGLVIGPLTAVFPWLPIRLHLMYGRRAIGVSAFAFAIIHVVCYAWPLAGYRWREFYAPGLRWVLGLILGLVGFMAMTALALTSADAAVKRMGGRAWKRLHRLSYALLAVVLVHALLLGADFGLTRPPDVSGAPDAGAMIGFAIFTLAWLVLFFLRRRHVRVMESR